ncbi:hypothetical protein HZS_4179 [Henneguya salminicola]|nr:hypothetical protein HZS_4179 [Henneguya salminicola]
MYAENYPSPQDIFTTVEFFEGDNSDIEDLMDFTYEEVTITYDHDFSRPTRIERTTISSATYENTNCRYSNNSYAIEDSEEIMEIEYSSSESDE